jgi:putative Holliday junction resolvase
MGCVLAIDFGLKRNGLAISDPGRSIASPLAQLNRDDPAREAGRYAALAREHGVDRIVVGLPMHGDGREGHLADAARAFGARLGQATGLPVVYQDERYTTVLAEEILRDHRVTFKKRRELRDRLAAQILLQAYLDRGCPDADSPAEPLADPPENRA